MIYADTSFLASAYGLDANTAAARKFIEANHPRLPLLFLHWPELAKAFWTSHPENAEKLWDWVKEDVAGGKKLYPLELEADLVAKRAAGLIINFCPRWKKLRSLDALHVAAAHRRRKPVFKIMTRADGVNAPSSARKVSAAR